MATDRAQEIVQFIAGHEQEIVRQQARMTRTAACTTLYLAHQRIKALQNAIRALRLELAGEAA